MHPLPPASDAPAPLSRMAWVVVLLLMAVALLNYLDRQMLASMKFSVMADIPTIAKEANWGFMLASFKWVYAVVSLVGGYLADRYSKRLVICSSLVVWSAVTWLTGQVSTYNELLATRALMGISEAFYIPAALALIADFHVGHTRSRAVGLHQMAIYCGVIIGGFSGFIADSPTLGWRSAFEVCGIIGIVYAVPLAFLLRDAPAASGVADLPPASLAQNYRELLTNGSFLLLVLYFTLPAMAGWVVRDWMPAILKDQFAISQGKAGIVATVFWQSAAIVGVMLGGWIADRWMHRNIRGRIYTSAIGMVLIVPAIFGMGIAPTLYIAAAFLILFGLGWGFFDCNNMPILSQIARPHLRATGFGIMNFVSISCGGLADWGFGKMRDHKVSLPLQFSTFAAAAIVSIILVLLIRPKKELSDRDPAANS